MTGIFAEWQGRYAAHRVATFPIMGKKPCVRSWNRIGLPYSAELAKRFADADGIGFQCGPRSRITIVDVDSSDERILQEAVKLFGPSPLVSRTGSGNFAIWYRHNGEPRRIRGVEGLPVDILGAGLAVVPGSLGKCGPYKFLEGNLADIDHLPPARSLPIAKSADRSGPWLPASDDDFHPSEGQRHDTLKRALSSEIWHYEDRACFFDRAIALGRMNSNSPLGVTEITSLAEWFWRQKSLGIRQLHRRDLPHFHHPGH